MGRTGDWSANSSSSTILEEIKSSNCLYFSSIVFVLVRSVSCSSPLHPGFSISNAYIIIILYKIKIILYYKIIVDMHYIIIIV